MGEYDPAFYDLVNSGPFQDDIDWYRARAREAEGPVLELGAGTGRITIPIARDGVSICALDAEPRMLDALRVKLAALPADVRQRVTMTTGDMRSFQLEPRFALVIAPFRAFLHNLTTDDQRACVRCVYEHLRPGGRFAFNVFHPSLEFMSRNAGPLQGVWRWRDTYPRPDGGCVLRSDANRYDTVRQRVYSMHRHEEFDAEGTLTRTYLQRLELAYLYPADIRYLLTEGGFTSIAIEGDFHGRPFERDTDELVVVAQRP
jgi:SAM-dependent methyltransferase